MSLQQFCIATLPEIELMMILQFDASINCLSAESIKQFFDRKIHFNQHYD